MTLAFLLGMVDTRDLPGWEWFKPSLLPSNIVYVGLRDVLLRV
jgi:hypothetical protein